MLPCLSFSFCGTNTFHLAIFSLHLTQGKCPTPRNKVNPLLTRNFALPIIQSKHNESQCSGVALSVTLFYTVRDNQISFFYAGKYNHIETEITQSSIVIKIKYTLKGNNSNVLMLPKT